MKLGYFWLLDECDTDTRKARLGVMQARLSYYYQNNQR